MGAWVSIREPSHTEKHATEEVLDHTPTVSEKDQPKLRDASKSEPVLEILEGDCRSDFALRFTENKADRVILGLLPSTKVFWRTACRMLNKDLRRVSGGRHVHIHENVRAGEESVFAETAREAIEQTL